MLLDQFFIKVKDNSEQGFKIIRQVNFIEGLNIISDKTPDPKSSGNNVGKTTFIRLIKFCLGGDKDSLFKDKELKVDNDKLQEKIEDYFFELTLKGANSEVITLSRDFKKNYFINEERKTDTEYKLSLRNILFNINADEKLKPTLGELLVKFIKVDINQITNLFKMNHSTTNNYQYEAMWLVLFGYPDIKDLSDKFNIMKDVKQIGKKDDSTLNSLEQELPLLQSTLVDLQKKSEGLKTKDYVIEKIEDISQIQADINYLKEKINFLIVEIKEYENQKLLIGNSSEIDSYKIESIYKSVKIDLPNLSNNFDKVINFYNTMMSNKLEYISNKLSDLNKQCAEKKEELNILLEKEKGIILFLKTKKDFGEYENINDEILEISKQIESKETRIAIIRENIDQYDLLNTRINNIEDQLDSFQIQYNENLKIFNKYFANYTDKIYSSKYYVKIDKKDNKYFKIKDFLLAIDGLDSLSTGDKRGLIYLFDLAYLNFSIEKKLKVPYFFLHDQLETIYYKNIEKMFEITNGTKGQCIVSLLSDKIKDFDMPINPILELSQDDKLFRV